jgi:Ca-activated chloride channel family protein
MWEGKIGIVMKRHLSNAWTTIRSKAVLPGTLLVTLLATAPAWADPSEAPYFLVEGAPGGDEGNAEAFPLKGTAVETTISGVIADVKVTQRYANTGSGPIEAVYVFPGSTRAAVYGMEMKVGGRVTKAKIHEREEAKAVYAKAKSEKKNAALLEQERPNVFQMKVANILPGDEVEVVLRYTEHLVPEGAEYRFVFPGVVGPRYTGSGRVGEPDRTWVANPYLVEGVAAPAGFALTVNLNAGMPIQEVACDTHKVDTRYTSKGSATVSVANDPSAADRDFILRYRLAGDRVEGGWLVEKAADAEGENFFLLTVQPPTRVAPEVVVAREYVFIVDVSGSMSGFPLETAKRLFRELAGELREGEKFNVLLFAGSSQVLGRESLEATPENITKACAFVENARGGGGTELEAGLRRGYDLPRGEGVARSMVVITDGFINVEADVLKLIRSRLDQSSVYAFGIGSSVNRFLIEGMARAGGGEEFVITEPSQSAVAAMKLRKMIDAPVLAGVSVTYEGFEAYDVEPASFGDVLGERPLVVFGKWRGELGGNVRVRGTRSNGEVFEQVIPVEAEGDMNPGLRYLWARHRIAALGDDRAFGGDQRETRQAITNLGLTYNLLTEFTAFVAVDEVPREFMENEAKTVKQPLSLPQGVSNTAIGGGGGAKVHTTPEPAAPLMLLIGVLTLLFARYRRER